MDQTVSAGIEEGTQRDRLRGVDWLRSLAIIGVTLFHVFPALVPGGFLGVNLFFILSGFLAAYGAAKVMDNDGSLGGVAYLKDY